MEIILALFIFGQTYADTTCTMYGATLENTHFQIMAGAMQTAPNVKWSYQTDNDVESYGAAVADVDKDGTMDVVIGSWDNKVYCLNGIDGTIKWSYITGDKIYSAAAIADIDGDGNIEVVIGSDDGNIYSLRGIDGTVEWNYATGGEIYSSPAVADIDKDGNMEVVVGSFNYKVYCLDGRTGIVKWSYKTGGKIYSSPAIADIDGDGNMEVVIGSFDFKVYCLNGADGTVKWSYKTGHLIGSSPAVADVDKDGNMEVMIGSYDQKIYCLKGTDGTVKWSYETGYWIWASPAIVDVERDKNIEVIIGSWDEKVYCLNGVDGSVKWSYNAGGRMNRGVSIADIDGEYGEHNFEILVPNHDTDSLICLNGENGSVLWIKELGFDIHNITIADIDNDRCVELIFGDAGENKIWALDDVGNISDCKRDTAYSIEENSAESYPSRLGIEFMAMGKGVYLFTPNAVEVNIDIYNISGKLQQTIYKGVLNKGGHTFIPNIKTSGVYFVVLKTQKFKDSIKLINLIH